MASDDLESTTSLLEKIRHGDSQARERLIARYRPLLLRWAHRRLPDYARQLCDTDDLVQDTLIRIVTLITRDSESTPILTPRTRMNSPA